MLGRADGPEPRELIEGNVGAKVRHPRWSRSREGQPVDLRRPTSWAFRPRSGEELERTSPPTGAEERCREGQRSSSLKTADGDQGRAASTASRTSRSRSDPKAVGGNEEFRNLLTLKLDWAGGKAEQDRRAWA